MKKTSLEWLRNKTARRYLHSYLLISIVPVIFIICIFCASAASTMHLQLEKDMQTQLEQIKNEIDSSINYMENSLSHFSQLMTVSQNDKQSEPITSEQIAQQLHNYQQNFHLSSTLIYFPRGGASVCTEEGLMHYDRFLKDGLWRDQLDLAGFYTKLNSITGRTLTSSRRFGQPIGDYLIYMAPVPTLDVEPMGTAAFLIEKRQIDQMLQSQLGSFDGYFLMYDNFYGLAYHYGSSDDVEKITEYVNVPDGGGTITQQDINDEPFVMLRTVSGNYGFTYFYAVPTDVFYAPIRERILIYTSLGIAIILFLLVAAYLSTIRSFRPIRKLAADMLNIPERHMHTDLFEQISSRYQSITAENDTLQEQIQLQSTMSRQRILTSLLYGWRGNRSALQKTLAQVGIEFSYPDFFVAVVQLDEKHDPQEVLLQVFEQPWAKARPWSIYLLETSMSNTAALLFNLEYTPELRQLVSDEMAELLQENGCSQVKIGTGGYRNDPISIGASYCEALVALQDSASSVSLFRKPDTAGENYLCPQVEGKMFQQSMLSGSREMALELLGQMTDVVRSHQLPFHTERCFCFFIVNLLLQIKSSLNAEFADEEMIYMASNAQLDQFLPFCENLIIQICRQIEEQRSNDQNNQANEMLRYIRENFGDYSLSVEHLTTRFGISERAVRQILREQTGGGLTSYLTTLRMDWIKQQLAETDTPIRELIAQVGYTDVSSFTRKFKLLEGMTPGQYRSISRGE